MKIKLFVIAFFIVISLLLLFKPTTEEVRSCQEIDI